MGIQKTMLPMLAALVMLFAVMLMTAGTAYADDQVTVDGIDYSISDGTATVTGPKNTDLETLEIPASVTYSGETYNVTGIGKNAFQYNESIKAVTMPDGMTKIGETAFFQCLNLETVHFPDTLTEIGGGAFSTCEKLGTIDLPDTIIKIGSGAFSLTAYDNEQSHWEDGVLYIGNYLIKAVWANDTGSVPKKYTIKSGTLLVADEAFMDRDNLTEVSIPLSLKSIGDRAFRYCDNLSKVAFHKKQNLTEIGKYAFADCGKLHSIDIPIGVETIGDYAFWCSGLESVDFPRRLVSLGKYSFAECENLKEITHMLDVKEIGENAFTGCTSLETITLPETLTKIGAWAFYGCKNLKAIELPDTVTEINEGTFYECRNLAAVTLPDTLTEIGDSAFNGCRSLAEIELPGSLMMIGMGAFEDTACYNNQDNWEGGVLYIGNYLIKGASEGANIVVRDYEVKAGTRLIAAGAFACCDRMTEITIPASVVGIGEEAFVGCTALETIHYGGSKVQWNAIAGNGKPEIAPADYGLYDITFDANNGSGKTAYQTGKGAVTLAPNPFTYEGYLLAGWKTEADGSGTAYADQSEFDLTGDITLYAQWKQDIAFAEVTLDKPSLVYNGASQKPELSQVEWNGAPLAERTDYTAAWPDESISAGTYSIRLTGVGSYAGTLDTAYTITAKSITPEVSLSPASYVYNGKAKAPKVTVKDGQTLLVKDKDYTVTYAPGRKNVGTYKVTVKLKGNYAGTGNKTFKITKAKNTLAVKGKTAKVSYKTLKKKTQTLGVTKVIAFTNKGQGAKTYTKVSGNKKITINKTTGKVTVKKGLKKGTYTVKIKVSAAVNGNYLPGAKTAKVTVKVK